VLNVFDLPRYLKAAEQGNSDAQCNLAHCYNGGMGVEPDHRMAVKWYRNSAKLGHAGAQCMLGDCYRNGKGVERDYKQAIFWYRKSSNQGDFDSLWKLNTLTKILKNEPIVIGGHPKK